MQDVSQKQLVDHEVSVVVIGHDDQAGFPWYRDATAKSSAPAVQTRLPLRLTSRAIITDRTVWTSCKH